MKLRQKIFGGFGSDRAGVDPAERVAAGDLGRRGTIRPQSTPAAFRTVARKIVPAKRAKKSATPARKTASALRQSPEMNKLQSSLEGLSVADLRKVIESATTMIEQKTEGVKRSFIEEVTARAASLGLSVTDLFSKSTPAKAAPAKSAGGTHASPAVKYRGPNGEEWSGRGRPARWITELEAQGKKRADYAV
jgi:DNA-binding protein H-NS